MSKIAVIGSGIAGMSSAIRLACRGHAVDVFEANSYAGGKVTEVGGKGYRFDAGPSLFTLPHLLDDLFEEAGEQGQDHYHYDRLNVITKYFYEDGTIIHAFADPAELAVEISRKTGEAEDHIAEFLRDSKTKYDLTAFIFLFRSMHRLGTYFQRGTLKTLFNIHRLNAFRTMHEWNQQQFSDERVIQLFNRYATYNGSNPYQAPATLNVIAHLEHNIGAFFLSGGMHKITACLYELAKRKGVRFHFNSKVDEIVVERKQAKGVKVKNSFLAYDICVSNMDVVNTYRRLMPFQVHPDKILDQPKSSSALIFYWGIRRQFNQLDLHNIFFSGDYKREFDHIFELKQVHRDPTVYLYISSKLNADDAPEGCENWFTMINVPHIDGQNWTRIIRESRKQIINKLNRMLHTDIEPLIEFEDVLDPNLIETRTSSFAGALYGNSSNNKFAAFLRHPNFSRRIQNLFFCGGSVHPGGGIPLCLLSGKIVADLIK